MHTMPDIDYWAMEEKKSNCRLCVVHVFVSIKFWTEREKDGIVFAMRLK